MKAHNLKYTVAFFLLLSPFGMFAQQQMATDSISIFELMDAVEKGTSCRVYTTITVPFKVKRAEVNQKEETSGSSCPLYYQFLEEELTVSHRHQ